MGKLGLGLGKRAHLWEAMEMPTSVDLYLLPYMWLCGVIFLVKKATPLSGASCVPKSNLLVPVLIHG